MPRYICACYDFKSDNCENLTDMINRGRKISSGTFFRHIPASVVKAVREFSRYAWGHEKGLRLRDDWAVRFYTSMFEGRRVYYIKWSAIEFIFYP